LRIRDPHTLRRRDWCCRSFTRINVPIVAEWRGASRTARCLGTRRDRARSGRRGYTRHDRPRRRRCPSGPAGRRALVAACDQKSERSARNDNATHGSSYAHGFAPSLHLEGQHESGGGVEASSETHRRALIAAARAIDVAGICGRGAMLGWMVVLPFLRRGSALRRSIAIRVAQAFIADAFGGWDERTVWIAFAAHCSVRGPAVFGDVNGPTTLRIAGSRACFAFVADAVFGPARRKRPARNRRRTY
jgi:hypothetical protein